MLPPGPQSRGTASGRSALGRAGATPGLPGGSDERWTGEVLQFGEISHSSFFA